MSQLTSYDGFRILESKKRKRKRKEWQKKKKNSDPCGLVEAIVENGARG